MTGLKLAASTRDPLRAGGTYTHIEHNMIDQRTLEHVVNLVWRVTKEAEIAVKATALWAQELIIYRDTRGVICGVHGFRYADIKDGANSYRLVYSPFSVVDERFVDPEIQLGQVGTRLYSKLQTPGATIVWGTFASCAAPPGGFLTSHTLVPGADTRLPATLHFYTDAPTGDASGDLLPSAVEAAFAGMIEDEKQNVNDAKAGRIILVPLWRRIGSGSVTALFAAAAILFMVTRHHAETDEAPAAEAMRTKGGVALHVYRQTATGSEETVSRGAFSPGDHLQFGVDLPVESRVAVVGVQAGGDLYSAWPPPGSAPQVIPAGSNQILDGAIRLDSAVGIETLYLVTCSPTSLTPTCKSQGAGASPACPVGCTLSPFVLTKRAP